MTSEGSVNGEKRTLIIALFSHIEVYPPSLNALHALAPLFDEVYVLVRNVCLSNWNYPANVRLVTTGEYVPLEQVGRNPLRKKVKAYISFGLALRRLCSLKKPLVVLLYDAIPFSLYHLFVGRRSDGVRPVIWYHNHDVSVEEEVGKFSLMRVMKKLEIRYFELADIFSLPNRIRLKYFPIERLKNRPLIIPNYPSCSFFGKWRGNTIKAGENVRLIFQGQISPSNRIEEFIQALASSISGHKLELHLAGPINPWYQEQLVKLARKLSVGDRLFIYGRLPYKELPALTSSCHIGLAIYGYHNTMVRTMSTASNKIFEYASVGLPVIINLREDLKTEFQDYPWIHFLDEAPGTLAMVLERIICDYPANSAMARRDFEKTLNFESVFSPLKTLLESKMQAV